MSGALTDTSIVAGASGAVDAYTIDQSCRFNQADTPFLTRTPSSTGNQTKFTLSVWIKRCSVDVQSTFFSVAHSNTANPFMLAQIQGTNTLRFSEYSNDTTEQTSYTTTQLFRDPSSWYHIVYSVDTTDGTAADRLKLYVNGERVTAFSGSVNYSASYASVINSTAPVYIGKYMPYDNSSAFIADYLAEYYFIDGTAYDADDFGETNSATNEWIPKDAVDDLTFGTNGFYFKFQDSSAFGDDSSGNTNDFAVTNLVATDQMTGESPTNNFATINPLIKTYVVTDLTEGNLKFGGGSGWNAYIGTIGASSGKWYWEVIPGSTNFRPSVTGPDTSKWWEGALNPQEATDGCVGYESGGNKQIDNVSTAYGASFAAGDIIGVALDLDAGTPTVTFYKNNATQGAIDLPSTLTSQAYVIPSMVAASYGDTWQYINFGQDSSFSGQKTAQNNQDANDIGDFYYAPPAGYLALCTDNLPSPSIADPTDHFNTVLYTGDGNTGRAVTGVGFQPDLTWIKNRDALDNNVLVDAVGGANEYWSSNASAAKTDDSNYVTSLDSGGFTVGSAVAVNTNTEDFVSWNWKANGSGSSNTDGSITSTVSANTTAGVSIIQWTGTGANATIGHGLSEAPTLVIAKVVSTTSSPPVGGLAGSMDFTDYMYLDGTAAYTDSAAYWNDTAPTSSLISLGTGDSNISAQTMIAYAFHSVEGYSKVGSYTGNGNADGTFFHLGFRPAFILLKSITSAGKSWYILDNKRDGFNVNNFALNPNYNYTEAVTTFGDLVSNGIKWRTTSGDFNASGIEFLFYAVAETPFKTANAR